ncbi:aldo/keto reductase [Streptomyces sp. Je 1-369]|uniref:aldo/keto reductase n=1 Tax=Streptomyces sp. Je 1-369 TaxID=2966192 RepID=UPI0022855D4A|nr:aldo/keto reductase [Streptomyces sp. Je 1-369]WAL98714.1 aldo/keto reductase [Streptomyces sp. Je 1-369]
MATTENTSAPRSSGTAPAAAAGPHLLGGDRPVHRMGFGAMRLPAAGWDGPPHDPDRGIAVLRRAVELGVNHIDTAAFYFYEDIAANDLIRRALHPYPDDLVIATKVGPGRLPDGSWLDPADPAELRAAVHRNLRELGRDHLDLVYLRFLRTDGPGGDRFATLAALRDEGLIRHLGVSNATPGQFAEAQEIAPVVAVQNRFSPLTRDHGELVELCAARNIAYVPYFPFGGAGAPDLAVLERVADRHGATPAQVTLAWLLAVSPTMLAIPGTSSPDHLEENVAAAALRLGAEDLAELDGLRDTGE